MSPTLGGDLSSASIRVHLIFRVLCAPGPLDRRGAVELEETWSATQRLLEDLSKLSRESAQAAGGSQ